MKPAVSKYVPTTLLPSTVKKRLAKRQLKILDVYKNTHTSTKLQCMICQHVWCTTLTHVFSHHSGCPLCSQGSSEKRVGQWLRKNIKHRKIVHHFRLHRDLNPTMPCKYVEPDFAITDRYGSLIAFIEYNGIQHYQPLKQWGGRKRYNKQVKRDQWFRKFCKERNIRLIEIDGRFHVGSGIDEFLRNTYASISI